MWKSWRNKGKLNYRRPNRNRGLQAKRKEKRWKNQESSRNTSVDLKKSQKSLNHWRQTFRTTFIEMIVMWALRNSITGTHITSRSTLLLLMRLCRRNTNKFWRDSSACIAGRFSGVLSRMMILRWSLNRFSAFNLLQIKSKSRRSLPQKMTTRRV